MKYLIHSNNKVEKLVNNMNWKQLLNQVCCPNFMPSKFPEQEYGAVFFHPDTKNNHKERIEKYKMSCKIPPLVTTDMEAGPGHMIIDGTRFPSMMACGKCNDPDLAYKMGKAAAIEGKAVGFNWSLAPCVDIIGENDNPITSVRSVGYKADLVTKITKAYIKGMQGNGMIATAKHFPGDGFSTYDQHLTTSINPLSKEQWYVQSGKVFKELIQAGVMTIMPGHIALPAFDMPDDFLKLCPPATLSKILLTDLLRNELGFRGMIVSDAMNMGGVANFMNYYDACATFWESGGDCLLFPNINKAFYIEMETRLENGKLSIDTLKERATRVLSLKSQTGLLNNSVSSNVVPNYSQHAQWAKEISSNSIEIVRDRAKVLPFKINKETKILHLIISNSYQSHTVMFDYFTDSLQSISGLTKELIDPGPDQIFDEISNGDYDLVLCSIGCQATYGFGTIRLHGAEARNMMMGWMRLGTPVIFVNHFNPGVENEFDAAIDTLVNTYRSTEYSIQALLKLIFTFPDQE